MFLIIDNPLVLSIILSLSLAISVSLIFLMRKLVRQQPKVAIRILGVWIIIYPILFLVIPMLDEFIWLRFFLGSPISRAIKMAVSYPFFHAPSITVQCKTPIFPTELFFYCLWLAYFVSAIGIFKFKNWARVLGIYAAEVAVIFSFELWLYNGLCLDVFVSAGIFSGAKMAFKNLNSLNSLFENILPIGLPGLIFWVLLTHKEVKTQFNRK
ncbi:MAG: hypothetical protein AB1629_00270 [Candidatus Omnitrophota bacterium]